MIIQTPEVAMKGIDQVRVPAGAELEAIWLDRVRRWKSSGKTGQEFAAEEGVALNRLHAWTSRFRKNGVDVSPPPSPTLALVAVARPSSPVIPTIELEVAGVVIRVRPGFDPDLLREVVVSLEARS